MTKKIKNTATQRIRAAIAYNPELPAKDIAKVAGTSVAYVYSVRYKDLKAFGEKNKAAILRKTYPDDPVYADSQLTLTNGAIEHIAKELGPDPVVQPFDAPPEVTKFMGVTMVKDDITNLTDEQVSLLVANLGKLKQRMQSSQIEMIEPQADPVNHPPHYKAGGIETIDFIEAKKLNYNLGNVVKYLTRADLKGNRKQDLEKALWYLNRELSSV